MQIVRMPYTNHLRHTQQFLDHFLHFIVHPFEVAVQHDFLLAVILELIDFRHRAVGGVQDHEVLLQDALRHEED